MRALADAELLRRLVGFTTVSGTPTCHIADFISSYLRSPEIRITRHEDSSGDMVDLVIEIGPPVDASREGLVMVGHLDVVPALEPEWETDPFQLQELDERFVGRGTADMKGFVALAINLAVEAAERGLKRPLVLMLTRDEEIGGLGARQLAEVCAPGSLPRAAIVGEPTGLQVVRMHKGHFGVSIKIEGKSAHSSCPQLGKNAVEAGARAVNALTELQQQLRAEGGANAEHFAEAPYVVLSVGRIEGGTAVNIVPDTCRVDVGVRPLPGMISREVFARVTEALAGALEGFRYEVAMRYEIPPYLSPEDASICEALCEIAGQSDSGAVPYATDAGWLQRLELECAIWGPGSIEVAHRPNEHLSKEDLARARELLEKAIVRFCQ